VWLGDSVSLKLPFELVGTNFSVGFHLWSMFALFPNTRSDA
jgi:hypothetical protein